ncbi:MAG: type II toxin-antitoxin system RelE/ParE family toxin [Chthoniobacterales bacterium]|nr:type II toxin-antitoxin system RelE/ParE family toxin [Chthoniobacterales bacterium]
MGYRIVFAPQAHARLEEIVRFIAQDNPRAAIRFGDYLIDRAESLAQFPELGTPYRKRQNVRRLLCKSYLIYYRLRSEQQLVEIMDFWHSARRDPVI